MTTKPAVEIDLDAMEEVANQVRNGYASAIASYTTTFDPDNVLALIAQARASQAVAEPVAYLYEWIGDEERGPRKKGDIIARAVAELGGNIDLYPDKWKRIVALSAAPVAQQSEAGAPTAAAEQATKALEEAARYCDLHRVSTSNYAGACADVIRQNLIPKYAAPTSGRESAAPVAEQDAKDAARYRWLMRQVPSNIAGIFEGGIISDVDQLIDEEIEAQKGAQQDV